MEGFFYLYLESSRSSTGFNAAAERAPRVGSWFRDFSSFYGLGIRVTLNAVVRDADVALVTVVAVFAFRDG